MKPEINVFTDPFNTALAVAERMNLIGMEAIQRKRSFMVSLSGGKTPKTLFEVFKSAEYSFNIDWEKTHLFWGDERYVPTNHESSNYRMVKESMLDHIEVPVENIHRIETEFSPLNTAFHYEQVLREYFKPNLPGFDLVLLGLGEDGHTASVFPYTSAIRENTSWVVAQRIQKFKSWRITITPNFFNMASNIIFFVTGSEKAKIVQRVIEGSQDPDNFPAQIINPTKGKLAWYLDEAAAALLTKNE